MPALNESTHIIDAIHTIRPTTLDHEILIIDGGSTDGTKDLIQKLAIQDDRIRLIENPARRQSAGINLGAQLADRRSDIFVRADCHAIYPENFVETCVSDLISHACASVVVPMRSEGCGCTQKAIAAAQNHYLGNGGSAHRNLSGSGFVSHGHHAAFNRRVFLELGGYDETMIANEDAEFDYRLSAHGHRIFMSAQATIVYFPRSDLPALARQYFHYGSGRAINCAKHGYFPAPRQILPALLTTGVASSLLASFFTPMSLIFPLTYLFFCLAYGFIIGLRSTSFCQAGSGIAAIVMHMSWGAGFLYQLGKAAPSFIQSKSKNPIDI
jgi:succinoglycan biosynthesis protein ExoA